MLALRLLWRDWRSGELRVLTAALIIAVAIVTAIGLFADRLQTGLEAQSAHFLAADRVLRSSRPVAGDWLQAARDMELVAAEVVTFRSMVFVDQDDDAPMQLASIKAVSDSYPLRGSLEVSGEAFGEGYAVDGGPRRGEVWLDSRLLPLLGIAMEDYIIIGEARLRVTKALLSEPDRGSAFSGLGPRVMMNLNDLPTTGIIQPGSRVQYRYLFAGTTANLSRFSDWLQPQLQPSHRWVQLESSRPRVYRSLQRAEQYLMLAGAIGVGLAGVAIALAAHRYSARHYDYVAIMKSLGAARRRIISLYAVHLLVLGGFALVIGALIGWLLQASIMNALQEFFSFTSVPAVTLKPFFVAALTSLVCLIVFALPPLISMCRVSPLRVLRRDFQPFESGVGSSIVFGVLGVAGLMLWYSGNWWLSFAVLLATLSIFFMLGVIVWLVLRSARTSGMQAGSILRLTISAVRRRGMANAVQVVIFSLSIMLLLTLVAARTSLIEDWKVQLPQGTPNHFLINVTASQVDALQSLLREQDLPGEPLYPIVKGRMVSVNGEPVRDRLLTYDSDSAGDGLQRELNLTWSATLPEGNTITAGQWWDESTDVSELSMESGLAQRLGVKVGDQILFALGGEQLLVEVTSIRSLKWDSMKPNFYVIMPAALLNQYPATYITSFYLPKQKKSFLNQFIRTFPTITVIEMDQVLEQIRYIVDRVSLAIEWVLSLVVISALLVLLASVQSSLDTRHRESAVLRTLGASRQLIMGSLILEFSVLGAIAGVIAALAAEIALFCVQTMVLDMDYSAQLWMWIVGPFAGAFIVGIAGFYSCRKVVETPPITVLRTVS